MDHLNRKTPRRRAFAPKTRSGCLTCKKRRKKCDEEKPFCRRCRDSDYVCDGYNPRPAEAAQEDEKDAAVVQVRGNGICLTRQRLPGDPLSNYFCHHFFSCAVSGLMELPYSATFWTNTIVTHNHQNPFIQPAITALGAAHWLFLTDVEHPGVQKFVNDRYHKAIESLVPVMTTGHRGDLPAIMTSCLLFVCLESLRGDSAAALRHLEAGSRLFLDPMAQSARSDPTIQQLAAIFHALGTQVALFSEKPLLPDLAPYLLDELESGATAPFRTYYEANDALGMLDSCFNRLGWDEPLHCESFANDECKCPKGCLCLACQQWNDFAKHVRNFKTRLQPLLRELGASEHVQDRQRLLCLQLQTVVWEWTIDWENCPDDGLDDPAVGEMLDLVEKILILTAERPTFSLAIDVIPNLIFIYDFCPIMAYRHRAINLLRLTPRREVIFNSHQAAALLEDHMAKLRVEDGATEDPVVNFATWPHALIEYVPQAK